MVKQQGDKGQKLDQIFNQVDVKFTEAMGVIEKTVESDLRPKLNSMNELTQQTIGRLEQLGRELEQLKLHMAASRVQQQFNPTTSPPETPPGMGQAPSPPSSWTAGAQPSAPNNGPDIGASTTPGFGTAFGANFQVLDSVCVVSVASSSRGLQPRNNQLLCWITLEPFAECSNRRSIKCWSMGGWCRERTTTIRYEGLVC